MMSQLGKVVPIDLKDSKNQAGKKIADPHEAEAKKNHSSAGDGDRVCWNNKSNNPKIVFHLRFGENSWPFVEAEVTIEVPIDGSSKEYTVAQDAKAGMHRYKLLDGADKPVGESSGGPGDPGILVGD